MKTFLKNGETLNVGMPFERIKQEIYSRKPDIVGIAGPFTCQIENSVKISNLAKQVDPSILTVVGGPHVTTVPKEFLEEAKSVDVAVTGEGEYAMLELAQYFEGKKQLSEILGAAYRKDGEVIVNSPRPFIENLDELAYPALRLSGYGEVLKPKKDRLPKLQKQGNIDDYQQRMPL